MRFFIFISLALLVVFLVPVKQSFAKIKECSGVGYVRPANNALGTIYLTKELVSGRFKRLGYLPAGSVVELSEPTNVSPRFRREHCSFSLRSTISGHVDRTDIASLTSVLQRLKLDQREVASFIAPAHPQPNRLLKIFENTELAEVIYEYARGERALVLALDGAFDTNLETIKVLFVRSGNSISPANVEVGYIDARHDRDSDLEGTFRLYPLWQQSQTIELKEATNDSWVDRLEAFANGLLEQGAEVVKITAAEGEEELLKLAGCKREGEVTLEV